MNMGALFTKRTLIYKRDILSLFCEFFVPVALCMVGLTFVNNEYLYNSPYRTLTPDQLPLRQRILMNSNVINATGL